MLRSELCGFGHDMNYEQEYIKEVPANDGVMVQMSPFLYAWKIFRFTHVY